MGEWNPELDIQYTDYEKRALEVLARVLSTSTDATERIDAAEAILSYFGYIRGA